MILNKTRQKINVKFQYCDIIEKFEKEFNLSNRTFTIYAPNISMAKLA